MTTSNEHNNAPAVPQGVPAQEVIDAIEAWKSAWLKVPPFADRVNKATREAITISHNSLFLLLQSAQQAQRMPAGCPTPTGCGPHGCHGACIATPAPAPAVLQGWKLVPVEMTDEMRDAGNEFICNRYLLKSAYAAMLAATPAPAPAQEVGLTDDEIKHVCAGIYLSDHPQGSASYDVALARAIIAALRAKEQA